VRAWKKKKKKKTLRGTGRAAPPVARKGPKPQLAPPGVALRREEEDLWPPMGKETIEERFAKVLWVRLFNAVASDDAATVDAMLREGVDIEVMDAVRFAAARRREGCGGVEARRGRLYFARPF